MLAIGAEARTGGHNRRPTHMDGRDDLLGFDLFLDPCAKQFFVDWDRRPDPYDRDLSDLVGELSTQSEEFRGQWAAHNVRLHTQGTMRPNHPVVGDLELSYNRIEVPADRASRSSPGSKAGDALSLLASWAATEEAGCRLGGAVSTQSRAGHAEHGSATPRLRGDREHRRGRRLRSIPPPRGCHVHGSFCSPTYERVRQRLSGLAPDEKRV